jgi:4-aminobutyrate aminotransferase/(S)-3-amino-2-methylpropionate transaminase
MLSVQTALRAPYRALRTHQRALATHANSRLFPNEPSVPNIVTQGVPGPATSSASQQIGSFQDNKAHGLVVDYGNSIGNWLVDVGEHISEDMPPEGASY